MTETTTVGYSPGAPKPPKRGRGPLLALGVAAAVLLVGLLGLLAANRNEVDPAQPGPSSSTTIAPEPTPMSPAEGEQLVNDFVAALRAGDAEAATAMVEGGDRDFQDFLIALDTSGLEFFNCSYQVGSVRCTTTAGPNHFYERIHGEGSELNFSADMEDGQIANPHWTPSIDDMMAAAAFSAWAQEAHPELSDVMFDGTPMGILTGESGTAMMTLLDEFLIHRTQGVTEAFVAALRDRNPDAAAALSTEPEPDGFIHWITVLDTSGVEFFDCSYEPDQAQCTTTMGPDFWFERIHGENVENTFTVRIEAGKMGTASWPVPGEDLAVNSDFRVWVAENHPELSDVIFDFTPVGLLTRAAAEARVELLDEYLASL